MFVFKQLRREKKVTQDDLAEVIGVSKSTIQNYEAKGATIPTKNLTKLAEYFDHSIAELYLREVNEAEGIYSVPATKSGNDIKSIGHGKYVVMVPLVSAENRQRYMKRVQDEMFLAQLGRIGFVLHRIEDYKYMAFEITNKSMDNGSIHGIPNKAIVLGREVPKKEFARTLGTGQYPYWVLIYKNDFMCKRIESYNKKENTIVCHSLNSSPEYSDFEVDMKEVQQLFVIVKKEVGQVGRVSL
ncbi:MAG: helix-turn-helix domain-containing protein [Saonia sp.]